MCLTNPLFLSIDEYRQLAYNFPLVEGTPVTLPSIDLASSSALAKDLNTDSKMLSGKWVFKSDVNKGTVTHLPQIGHIITKYFSYLLRKPFVIKLSFFAENC